MATPQFRRTEEKDTMSGVNQDEAEAAWTAGPNSAEAPEMQEVKANLPTVEQAAGTTQTSSTCKSSGSSKGKCKARSPTNSGSSNSDSSRDN